jgi:uncharacterized protein YegP (UPF0339 family)
MSARDYDRICLYADQTGKVRWRYRAAGNSRILADSGQGYRTDDDAIIGAARVTKRFPTPHFEQVERQPFLMLLVDERKTP